MSGPQRSLVLDVQGLQLAEHADRGIPRFIRGHAEALIRTGRVAMMGFNPDLPLPAAMPDVFSTHPACTWNTAEALDAVKGPLAYLAMLPFDVGTRTETFLPPALEDRGALVAVTVYDLIPHRMRDRYLATPSDRRRYDARLQLLRTADVLLAISEQTRRDVVDLLDVQPSKVTTIGAGVAPFFRPGPDTVDIAAIAKPFLLCVAGEDNNRKNVEGLLSAYASLPRKVRDAHQLVVVCALSAAGEAYWRGCARDAGLGGDEVVFTGGVSDEKLRALYRGAVATVSPSLYEGFGLPAYEGAACGTPAIGASTSALRELTHDKTAVFPPEDALAMTHAIARVIDDTTWRTSLTQEQAANARRCTWDAVAAKTLAAIDDAPLRRPIRRRPRRPRVAVLTPLPPTMSGVADYSAHAIAALSALADVDAYSTGDPTAPNLTLGEARVRPVGAFGQHVSPTSYDSVIYVIGNNESHIAAVDAAARTPGIVWLHDTHLAGLHLVMDYRRVDPGWRRATNKMHERLHAFYGDRVPPQLIARWNDPDAYDEFSIALTAPVVSGARAVLVHSERAALTVERDRGPVAAPLPVHVVPFAASEAPEGFLRAPEPDRILVPGWMAPIKQPELAIDAFARVRTKRGGGTLAFVGNTDPYLEQRLRGHASRAGVTVEFHGYTSREHYWRQLSRASCALVLRRTSRGENSAALHDALRGGVPVVTNMELDAPLRDAVWSVPRNADAEQVAAAVMHAVDHPKPAAPLPSFDDVAKAVLAVVEGLRR